MSIVYDVNEFDEVVPYVSGRKANNTGLYRGLTEFEKQLLEEIDDLKRYIKELGVDDS